MNDFTVFNPDDILLNLNNKRISKKEAIKQLISIINETDNKHLRIKCIEYLIKINGKSNQIFKILEICLISDENEFVRVKAARSMALYFPKKAVKPLKWALKYETSPLVIKTLTDLFEGLEDTYFK
jgi:HEAT repeat protein